MTNIRSSSQVKGTVFDLPHAMSLPNDDCNVLFVSSRTLFFIQSFGLGEVSFTSRYASSFLPGARYVLAETASDFDDINDIINKYGLEVIDLTCDIVSAINGVQSAILTATSNACACGTVGETVETTSGQPGGVPPEGFGEPDPTIVDRTCKAANAVNASMLSVITELEASPVEGFLELGFGLVAGIVSAILAAAFIPVVGILVVSIAGTVVAVTLALLASGLNLTSLKQALDDNGQELVCALYEANSATAARDAYTAVLDGAGQSAVNVAVITALMTNNVLDLLWFSTSDSEAFLDTYVAEFDCSVCESQPGQWEIGPDKAILNITTVSGGPIGTGIVDNGGGSFTITSVPVEAGPSDHGICIQISGWNDNLPISEWWGGEIWIDSIGGSPAFFLTSGQRGGDNCASVLATFVPTSLPPLAVGGGKEMVFAYLANNGEFTMTFHVVTLPGLCP